MEFYWKNSRLAVLATVSLGLASLSDSAFAQSRYGHSPQMQPQYAQPRYAPPRYAQPQYQQPTMTKKYKNLAARLRGQKHIAYQVRPPAGMFQQWIEYEPQYTLVPGDQLEVVVVTAPELSRTLTVGPDGRIIMPIASIPPIMAANRTFQQVQGDIQAGLATQLRDPTVAITPRAYAPEQIYVGGQVGQPGTYTLPGRIGVLEGILMAGGLRPTARSRRVAVLRRAPNGGMMMRTVDIRGGLLNIREYNDNIQLRRGDIIYVPQSTIGEIGTFVQNLRQTLPLDVNLSYQFGNNGGGTTVLTP